MLELGVDDLITDKPDMVQDLLARNQQVDDSLIDFRDLLNALLHPEQPADSSDDAEGDHHRCRGRPGGVRGRGVTQPFLLWHH